MERKASLLNPKHQYRVPNRENMIVVPITKRKDIIMSVQVCLISQINFDCKENNGNKIFSWKSKALISRIPIRRNDYCGHNKKNGDYYGYPSFLIP